MHGWVIRFSLATREPSTDVDLLGLVVESIDRLSNQVCSSSSSVDSRRRCGIPEQRPATRPVSLQRQMDLTTIDLGTCEAA